MIYGCVCMMYQRYSSLVRVSQATASQVVQSVRNYTSFRRADLWSILGFMMYNSNVKMYNSKTVVNVYTRQFILELPSVFPIRS